MLLGQGLQQVFVDLPLCIELLCICMLLSGLCCRQAKIGPSQLGLAGGAVLFGLVFVLVSGGDFATSNRYKGLRPARPPPDPIEMAQLARQAEGFEARVQQDPQDLQVGAPVPAFVT